ncbi:MAG TPA: thioredoxin domain-containing protein [Thermoanaerobaculia bacterium]|nr:thioredoxin domain-containing protein [Thermoanaerobaculia bacterium]HUM30800.1 thioredoxin domain-containing protein [Thermoanaerobaculia bacterium]HXK69135.1 thioredoxin domain-containing protein [Thermoanaerobaculia bacterium]
MRLIQVFVLHLFALSVFAAAGDTVLIRNFAEKYQAPCDGGAIEVKVNTEDTDFTYYYVSRDCPHDKKHNFGMPVVYLPGEKTLFVGEYFNLKRLKEEADNPRAVEAFIGEFLGGKATLTFVKNGKGYRVYDMKVETGFGAVHHEMYRFKDFHVILGKAYGDTEDPRETRVREFPWGTLPSIGDPSAPHKLAVFLDLECPMCARVEKDLLEALKTHPEITASFVQFPLVSIHPWAFRGACGAMCFFSADPSFYFDFLTDMYAQRDTLDLDTIDYAVFGFADQRELRPHLLDCYLKTDNIRSVLNQLQLALTLGVRFTPGLYLDGTLYVPSDLLALLKERKSLSSEK